MPVFLGHSIYLIGNWIGFMVFFELCCQCIKWQGIFPASWYQIGTCPSLVHPWRLHSLHPWWWDRDFRGDNAWTWWGHVDLVLIICGFLLLIIFNDIGLYWGNRFGPIWTQFVRYNGLFFTSCCCGSYPLYPTGGVVLSLAFYRRMPTPPVGYNG